MFNDIQFLTFNDPLISEKNIARVAGRTSVSTQNMQEQFHSAIREQERHKFIFDGTVQLLLPYPVTPEQAERYYYPQVFAYCHCGPSYFTRRSDYDSFEVLYTYEGRGILEYEGAAYELGPGDGFFIDCRRPHHYYTAGDHWVHGDLHFTGRQAEYHYNDFYKGGDPTFHDTQGGQYQTLLELTLRVWDSLQFYKELQTSNYLSSIVAYLLVKKQSSKEGITTPESIRNLIRYIKTNFASDLTLDRLAEHASLSKYHLSREFKKYTGMSPVNYVIFTRIENAKMMLTHSDLPIWLVATHVGFSDINNFTNQFRKFTGMTPRKFRKK